MMTNMAFSCGSIPCCMHIAVRRMHKLYTASDVHYYIIEHVLPRLLLHETRAFV